MRRDPRVAISISPANNAYEHVDIRGRVVQIREGEAAEADIDRLGRKYKGWERYPLAEGEQRVTYLIEPIGCSVKRSAPAARLRARTGSKRHRGCTGIVPDDRAMTRSAERIWIASSGEATRQLCRDLKRETRENRAGRRGRRGLPQRTVQDPARKRPRDARLHRGQDAPLPHPGLSRRQGQDRALAVRPEPRPHRLPLLGRLRALIKGVDSQPETRRRVGALREGVVASRARMRCCSTTSAPLDGPRSSAAARLRPPRGARTRLGRCCVESARRRSQWQPNRNPFSVRRKSSRRGIVCGETHDRPSPNLRRCQRLGHGLRSPCIEPLTVRSLNRGRIVASLLR